MRSVLAEAAAAAATNAAEDTPSDAPTAFALDGSAHGGQLLASGRLGGGGAAPARQASGGALGGPVAALDALFLETGFQPAAALAEAQAALMQRLNAAVQARQADGYAVADCTCGSEREGPLRNLTYHVLLRRPF